MTTEDYLKEVWEKTPEHFDVITGHMMRDKLGIAHPQPFSGGACTTANCHDTTGCSSSLPNYYCVCSNGSCVAVPRT